MSQIDPKWLALALLAPLAQNFLLTLRWQTILSRCGSDLPLGQMFRYSMVALFFNQTLPSSVGGDAMRIWLVGKQANWRTATYSVLVDRVVGVVALAILVTACLPWTLALVRNPVGRSALLLIGLGCITGGVGLRRAGLGALEHPAALGADAASCGLGDDRRRHSALARDAEQGVRAFVRHSLPDGGQRLVRRAFGRRAASAQLCAVPGAAGDPDLHRAGFDRRLGHSRRRHGRRLHYAGLAPGDGLIVSLLYGATYLAIGVIGGLVWLPTSRRMEGDVVPAADGGG